MNIEKAKTIPLALILEKIDCNPSRVRSHESTYSSPLRNERTPSFQVNHVKNLWYDHSTGESGDTISFVCKWLETTNESHTVSDALRWLGNMTDYAHNYSSTPAIISNLPSSIL